jgi:acyl-CoA dehydrogenase
MVAIDPDQALIDDVQAIAHEVAAAHADDVDTSARFPAETLSALRERGALSVLVPVELGGEGLSLTTVARCCLELGRACGASAMVFAMHQIMVASIVRHRDGDPWFDRYLEQLALAQRLVASVTSEVGVGGDIGRSIAPLSQGDHGRVSFEKQAPTVSYAAYADDLLTTLRRAPDAEPGDQVIVLSSSDQTTLEQTGGWDVLGMRGTCSPGYIVRADVPAEQVMSASCARVLAESMVPISHILWSHLWLGICEDAFDRAHAFVRALAKRKAGEPLPAAHRLSQLLSELQMMRAEVGSGLRDFELASAEPGREWLTTVAASLRFNSLKIAASEHAASICRGALGVAGIMGFKNDSPYSIGRHLRDSLSASLMIANERIHETNANLLLIAKEA